MILKTYKTKFGPLHRGDRRPDGFFFVALDAAGREMWLSPRGWKRMRRYQRVCNRRRWQQAKHNPVVHQRHADQQQKDRRLHPERDMLANAKRRAKLRHLPYTITEKDIHIPERCPILGVPLIAPRGTGHKKMPNSASLDRIQPALGYTPENIIIVSELANRIKTDATPDQILQVGRFYKNLMRRKK